MNWILIILGVFAIAALGVAIDIDEYAEFCEPGTILTVNDQGVWKCETIELCLNNSDCTIHNLTITGNINNVTIYDQNITGDVDIWGYLSAHSYSIFNQSSIGVPTVQIYHQHPFTPYALYIEGSGTADFPLVRIASDDGAEIIMDVKASGEVVQKNVVADNVITENITGSDRLNITGISYLPDIFGQYINNDITFQNNIIYNENTILEHMAPDFGGAPTYEENIGLIEPFVGLWQRGKTPYKINHTYVAVYSPLQVQNYTNASGYCIGHDCINSWGDVNISTDTSTFIENHTDATFHNITTFNATMSIYDTLRIEGDTTFPYNDGGKIISCSGIGGGCSINTVIKNGVILQNGTSYIFTAGLFGYNWNLFSMNPSGMIATSGKNTGGGVFQGRINNYK